MKRITETIVAPTMHAMLTGAVYATVFGKGSPRVVRLTYTDGTTEEAYLTAGEIAAGKENWMALVGALQDAARGKGYARTVNE